MSDPDHSANELNREELERITGKEQPAFVPSTPDPQLTGMMLMLLRYVIMGAAGLGIGFASKIPDAGIQVLAQALAGLVMVGTVLYGRWERHRLAALDHAGSLRSAAIGIPVKAT